MSRVGVTVVEATGFFDVDVDAGGADCVVGADALAVGPDVVAAVAVLGTTDGEPIPPGLTGTELDATGTDVPPGVRSDVVVPCPVGVDVQPATTAATVTTAAPSRIIRERQITPHLPYGIGRLY